MACGAEIAGARALAHTIYVRPSRELIAQSWQWPASWHEAFEQTMAQIALATVTCILEGLPVTERLIALQLTDACVAFRIERTASRTYIAVLMFTGPGNGPDAPGPNGGCQQPRPADGLVLGLRGSGRTFQLVVFQGYMPAIPGPARNVLALRLFERAILKGIEKDHAVHSAPTCSNAIQSNSQYPNDLFQQLRESLFRAVQANGIGLSVAMGDSRAAGDPAANARTALWPRPGSHADWPVGIIHQLCQHTVAQIECARAAQSRSPTSSEARDARCWDKLQISVRIMRVQGPCCDLLPGHYLH
jgi:hypothetical protein